MIVLRRRLHGRVRFTNNDRWFFLQLYRWFPSILSLNHPAETLVRWHRAGFRCYGRWNPLLNLMTCVVCNPPGNSRIDPDDGNDLIQYRCKLCGRIQRLRLCRRTRLTDRVREPSGRLWHRIIAPANFPGRGHDKALASVIVGLMKDDTELFKQFSDNPEFKRWLTDTVFSATYDGPQNTISPS